MTELNVQSSPPTAPPPPPPPFPHRLLQRSCILFSQLTLAEISGSVGDLGTFVPLVVALARQDAISLPSALLWAGFANVLTGCLWDVPMCVQPMKSIAAVAIAQNLTKLEVTTAGIWMGLFMVLLSITNGIEVVNLLVPTPIVSGIQMGVGINLAIRGVHLIQELPWTASLDCILVAIVVALLCLYWLRESQTTAQDDDNVHDETISRSPQPQSQQSTNSTKPPVPVGLYLFGLGMLLALVQFLHPDNNNDDQEGFPQSTSPFIIHWSLEGATWKDWKQGLLEGVIPQLPLTTLNSVVSVCCLAHTLYPEKRRPQSASSSNSSSEDAVVSRRQVSWSVGIMNLLLCPLGAMPCCHGAGGLAGQHKFGARHGASVVFLGVNKMLLAVLLGGQLLRALEALPNSILGLMLVVCGHELALMGWVVLVQSTQPQQFTDNDDEPQMRTGIPPRMKKGAVIALITVIVDVGLHKTHYAALSGWVAYMIYGDGVQDYRAQWNGRSRGGEAEVEYSPIVATQEQEETNEDPLEATDV